MRYNFVYKTTNNLNGDYYYGVHSTDDLNDGYMGSGKRLNFSIKKYGKENFTREIVQYFSNPKYAYRLEASIVTPELIADEHCLNIAVGGFGGNTYEGFTPQELEIIGKKISKKLSGKKLGPMSEAHRQKLRKPKTEAHKQKLRGPKSEAHKQKMRENHADQSGKNNPMYGKNAEDYMTPDAVKEKRKKQSNSLKLYYSNPENRRKCATGSLGKKCVNNGIINKLVLSSEIDLFLNKGWKLGRIKR